MTDFARPTYKACWSYNFYLAKSEEEIVDKFWENHLPFISNSLFGKPEIIHIEKISIENFNYSWKKELVQRVLNSVSSLRA